ncbi:uncharacterized protein LOC110715539 isoform X1 [Chenopodium quinoa]|uniref:uncharacterized protein LOC110715539 isoform X1 n=1 Tax=Chenopodium quinoa TaxID=63459 RepID=UPI000B774D0C|nr:uncharacterized protein LOC110715539 isoform X1 [Chenopodium quinoa]
METSLGLYPSSNSSIPLQMTGTNSEVAVSFTRLLTDDVYVQQHISELTSPTPTPHTGTSSRNPSLDALDYINLEQVDGFGTIVDNLDSDEGDEEGACEENDIVIKTNAPSQSFNVIEEMDQTLCDSWITWLGNNTYNGEFSVGQEFDSLHQLKDIVKSYSITKNQSFRVVESEPSKYVVECKRKKTHNCPWKLRAIKDPMLPIFRVVEYNGPHANNCVGDIISGDHQNLTFEFV